MRLQGVSDGTLYALDGRTLLAGSDPESLSPRSRLPTPERGWDRRRLLHADGAVRRALTWLIGDFATATVHPLGGDDLLATTGRRLLSSHDGGRSWQRRRTLPASSPPFGVLPSAVCHHEGTTYLGEYPLDTDATPKLLRSPDRGRTWSAIELSDVRHVHGVQADPYGGDVWVTTGDADPACRIGRIRGDRVEPIGGGSQRWRAVELAFTPSAVLWGMDCVYADRNHVFRLGRDALAAGEPIPTRVHSVDAPVFFSATLSSDGTTWVAFSTAAEPGRDSTAPDRAAVGDSRASVVAAAAESNFEEWTRLASYPRYRSPADRLPVDGLPAANAYAFLASTDDRLYVNPFNTARDAGRIYEVDPTEAACDADGDAAAAGGTGAATPGTRGR